MTDEVQQEPSATEKIIMSSSKIINKLENLEVVKSAAPSSAPVSPDFPDAARPAYEIFGNLENLILFSDDDDDFFMPVVDDISHLAIVSQAVLSYIKTISPGSRLMKVSNDIHSQSSQWISSLFFSDSIAAFLPANTDCLSKALRLALTCKFGNEYLRNGIQGVKSSSIYVNASNPNLPDLKLAAHLIGLPQSSIKTIPSEPELDSINFEELEKLIAADKASDVVPLFLMADLGSSLSGGVDGTINELSEISEKHQTWLHVSGSLLASFPLNPNQSDLTKNISSMTLDFESWLGMPSIPTVLLHKQFPTFGQSVLEIESDLKKLDAFPFWTILQNFGRDRIVSSFAQAFQGCKILYSMVSKMKGFRLLSKCPPAEDDTKEAYVTVVLFQFDGSNFSDSPAAGDDPVSKAIEKVNNASYFDRLNSWLGQTLERDFPQVQLSMIDDPIHGTCIRYNPFELSVGEKVPSLETFTEFYEFFLAQSDILCATIQKKQIFNDLVETSKVLKLVHLSDDWAGLGGVHYVPEHMETIETDQGKTELNRINVTLVDKLRSSDNAFSLGESTDGVACIRFGMVTSETDIEELLDLVINAGNALQESSKVLDSMAEVIRKGISAAETDLRKEADEKVWNDGILRVVPVVGTMLNWINPLPKDGGSGIRGRSLNLQQGVVESTENIYKYHMQLPLNPSDSNGRSSHSRNESQSSTNSKGVASDETKTNTTT